MHEFSICEGIVEGVLEELERLEHPRKLLTTRIVAGRLHQLIPEHLEFAYEVLTRDTPAAGSTLEIVPVEVVGTCRACDWEGEIEPPLFQCASCGSFEIDTITGKELYLDSLEIEDHE